jgi:Protein of unknown function (DUF3450)
MHSGAPAPHRRSRVRILFVVALSGAPLLWSARAAEPVDAESLQAQMDRWIALEQRTADEQNEWRADKEVLTASQDVLRQEQEALRVRLQANELASGRFQARLEEARAELAAQEAAHAKLMAGCDGLEGRVRALVPRLPDPLKDKVERLLERLRRPADEEPVSASERTQILVSVLTAIDLFNNTLTLTHHLRDNGAGETVDVKVLYWGLAAGYAIEPTGRQAWVLLPGAAGWGWHDASDHAAEIKAVVDIYEKQRSPEMVMLPAGAEGTAP